MTKGPESQEGNCFLHSAPYSTSSQILNQYQSLQLGSTMVFVNELETMAYRTIGKYYITNRISPAGGGGDFFYLMPTYSN